MNGNNFMVNKYVRVYLREVGRYWANGNDIGLYNLGSFLGDVSDISSLSNIINYLSNSDLSPRGTNTTIIDQYGDYLEIREATYSRNEVEHYEDLPCLRIHRDEFARVLREWRDFIEKGGKEFIITLENGKLAITSTY